MAWFDVQGSETFYGKMPLKTPFFAADTVLLLLVSIINLIVLVTQTTKLGLLDKGYLLAALVGMWLLWGVAWGSHRRIRTLCRAGAGETQTRPTVEPLTRISASITHMGMFIGYLVNGLLLAEVGFLLQRMR
jgi:hypothetical protein